MVAVVVVIFLLLTVLGLAIGVSAAEVGPGEDGNAKGLGIGAAVWSGLTLLVSLFVGGMVATRTGMVYDCAPGMIEGGLVWVLAVILLIYMAGSGIVMLASARFGRACLREQGGPRLCKDTGHRYRRRAHTL